MWNFEWSVIEIDRNGFESIQPIYGMNHWVTLKHVDPFDLGRFVHIYATHICFHLIEPPKSICMHMLTFLSSRILFECTI